MREFVLNSSSAKDSHITHKINQGVITMSSVLNTSGHSGLLQRESCLPK